MSRPSATDARGRTVALCDPDDLPPAVRQAARLRVRRFLSDSGVSVSIAVLVMIPMLPATLGLGGGTVTRLAANLGPLLAGAGVLWLILLGLWLHSTRGPRIVRACLAAQRCAACGYDLSSLSPEPDGCTVCPECGAAWRVPN